MVPDIRAYLEIRTAGPSGFNDDGTRLLISSNLPGTSQIFRMDSPAEHAAVPLDRLTQLTDENEPVGAGYLPRHDRLLVAMDAGGNERHQLFTMKDAPLGPLGGERLADLVVDPDHIHRPGGVSRDGRLLAYSSNRRTGSDFDVYVRDLDSGEESRVYAPGGWTGAGGFSPDATYLALWELTERPGDNRSHLLHLPSGELMEIDPHDDVDEAGVGTPSWLPDESAFFCSSDVGRDVAVICRGSVAGGEVELEPVIAPGWSCGCAVDWTGRRLLVTWNDDGRTRARLHDPRTLEEIADVPLPGDGVASGFRFSRDGRYVTFGYSSSTVPGDAWMVDLDEMRSRRLTVSPSDIDPASLVEPELVRMPSFDGLDVPAFVYRPSASSDTSRPVVVNIHGGPESQYRPGFSPLTQYLVASGFAVIAPNVRGSTGYGKRYQHLDDVDKRLDSVADLAAVHDWVATQPDLDETRAALHGGSYGGYMVLAGLAFQPERWAAGVDVVGISSLVSFLENTSSWRRRFREREYGSLSDDHDLLVAASPITHIDRMRAPLFIVHGANDPRVPLSEAEQIHAALTARGVRCELAVYHDEGHGLAKLVNRIDAYPRVVAFLREVLETKALGRIGSPS
jgi:dipeptidyl aminopeptidase/acylaminoacyl peptidase